MGVGMAALPATVDRVARHTPAHINRRISDGTRARLDRLERAPRHVAQRRLKELNREWDVERAIEERQGVLRLLAKGGD